MAQPFLLFRDAPSSAELESLLSQVVEASLPAILDRVAGRVEHMSLSEARGYVRARAAQVVRRQTNLSITRHEAATVAWRAAISGQATERLIPQVLRLASVGVPSRDRLAAA